ncbi:MAG: phosphoribosylformylglycinamidine cyclo-ligase [Lachnospiraceae bacterium]|nr:phosphoribosylformylglycinamidine cyclo-ligase [Lachnospiraceae bacterium]
MTLDYRASGVDVEAGYRSVELMKDAVNATMRPEVIGSIGSFAGAFSASALKQMRDPVLLSGTDGVGTKLKIAFLLDRHDTIGIDCVAMCVNDIAAQGAEPLFFLDYIACGKNSPEKIARIVSGVAEGCKEAGCALIGGETAEHPGLMPEDEYDLAGFAVGVTEKADLIDGSRIAAGDVLIAVASSGVHSNGFSLVRRILRDSGIDVNDHIPELAGSAGGVLLAPTRIYVRALRALKEHGIRVKGASHITGGGFFENIPRMLPEGIRARVKQDACPVPPVFTWLQRLGGIETREMYATFNMGCGMMLTVNEADADETVRVLKDAGEEAYIAGETQTGKREAVLC